MKNILSIYKPYIWLIAAMAAILLFFFNIRENKNNAEENFDANDVIILIDVSRSMLTNDVTPNRLESALNDITDLVNDPKVNRVALITFSKLPNMVLPLTQNKTTILEAIKNINKDNIENTSDVNVALTLSNSIINTYEAVNNQIIIFTDGEMQQPIKEDIAETLSKSNIKIWANIIGTEKGGNIIDFSKNDFLKDENNKLVLSKIDLESFKSITAKTKGAVLNNANALQILNQFNPANTNKNKDLKDIKNSFFWLYIALALLVGHYLFTFIRKPKYFTFICLIFSGLIPNILIAQNYNLVNTADLENLIIANKITEAEKLITLATKTDTIANKLYYAILLQRTNKTQDALNSYETQIKSTDSIGLVTITFNKAVAYFGLQKFSLCIDQCKWLLLKNENNNDARILLQMALKKKKQDDNNKEAKNDKNNKNDMPLPENWDKILQEMKLDEQRIKKTKSSIPEKKGERNW